MNPVYSLLEGSSAPLGATLHKGGVNFAVFSENATAIELCIFDSAGETEIARHTLHGPHDNIFHGSLEGASAGLIYGFRALGPYAPQQGHRFNPQKLLLDPYAREIVGQHQWRAEQQGYAGDAYGDAPDTRDNAAFALKARVAASLAPLAKPSAINASRDLVLYELHTKGFSELHPDIPAELRGSYTALAHPAAIAHFKSLGVTTLSLLPVQYHLDEPSLAERGSTNYWGYNTLGFFCPDPRFATQKDNPSAVIEEFRQMVATLHDKGLEIVLDVVYNHTPEGDERGATLSFRGLDNASWYRLVQGNASHSENLTGCGNTLNVSHPKVTQFVLDSLRYWVEVMGVDGFRFDLAPVLGRTQQGAFDANAAFFTALRQDPVLSQVHLIAEPWDIGSNGYQVGSFPGRFLEWNDKFRDCVRRFWLQRGVDRGEFAQRFTASSDMFNHRQRRPSASINFIAVHDGYTLADMVSYSAKHNLANGENNRDGRDGEPSNNFGAEGATDDAAIKALRLRAQRALLATLLLAQGTPMLCAGDEISHSQQGNNNAYCQDNATTWLDWPHADHELRAFVSQVLSLRRAEPALHCDAWFSSGNACAENLRWVTPQACEMQEHDWRSKEHHAFACELSAQASTTLFIAFNPEPAAVPFTLPAGDWQVLLDSAAAHTMPTTVWGTVPASPLSLLVLKKITP
jgi:isoamylase